MEQIVKTKLKEDVEKAFSGMIDAALLFNDSNLNQIPFEGSWTPGQVIDHVIKATGGIPDQHTEAVDRPYDQKFPGIRDLFLNFDIKMKSPDFILPDTGNFQLSTQLEILKSIKARHIQTIDTKDLTVECLDIQLPNTGYLTRYEWISFIVVHTQRHTHQLQQIAQRIGIKID